MIFSRIAAIATGAITLGLLSGACSTAGPSVDQQSSDLGNVKEVLLSESTDENGVTEEITITLGNPASLNLTPIDTSVNLVSPWDYVPGESCQLDELPMPTTELNRGLAEQSGLHLVYFVAEFDTAEAAHDAQSGSSYCYPNYTTTLAADLGRSPGVATVERLQETSFNGNAEVDTRISPPPFNDEGPVIFSARQDRVVAILIDLDNSLDSYDGMNLARELAANGN